MLHKLCKACSVERDLSLQALDVNEDRESRAWGWKSTFERGEYRGLGELRRELKEKQLNGRMIVDSTQPAGNDQGPGFI